MKKIVTLSFAVLGIVFLSGCGQQPVSQTQPTTPAPVVQKPAQPTTQPVAENSNSITYINKTAGYQISLPAAWKEYTASDAGIGKTEIEFSFARPNVDQFNLFTLIEVPRASYKQYLKDASGQGYTYVGENSATSKNVIMCNGSCCDKGTDTREFDDFQKARCAEVPAILKTLTPVGWQAYNNDKYGFSMVYPSTWTLENNYKSASEKGDVGIVGMDNEFITLTSPTNNYVNIGVTKKGGASVDTGDVSTGRGLDKFVNVGSVKINDQTSQFSFMSGQNSTVSSGTMKPIEIGNYEIHAFFLFAKDQKQNLAEKDQDFQTAVKIIESIKLPKN